MKDKIAGLGCTSILMGRWLSICFFSLIMLGCTNTPNWKGLHVNNFEKLTDISSPTIANADAHSLKTLLSQQLDMDYRIGRFDELSVSVWGRPDLGSQIVEGRSSQRRVSIVNSHGEISLPFVSALSVAGLTITEVKDKVIEAYSSIIETPEIEVHITDFKSQAVYVEGAVSKPGKIHLNNNINTLSDVVNAADGFLASADITAAEFIRDGVTYPIDYYSALSSDESIHSLRVKDGDRIYFPMSTNRNVYVFGEVLKQRKITIPPSGMSLTEVLAMVYGPNVISGDVNEIYFIRPSNPKKSKLFKLKLNEILEGPEIAVQPMDRVYVAPTSLAIWDRTWRQLLPFLSAGSSTSNIYEISQQE